MIQSRVSISLLAALALGHALLTEAADPDPVAQNPTSTWYALDKSPGWHFDAGIGFEHEPTYAGSTNSESEVDFFGRALYRTERGHRFFATVGEVGAMFTLRPQTQLTAFFEYEEGRDDEDEPVLAGLNPIDSTIEGQFTLAQRFGNTSIFAVLQPDILGDANKGLVWFVGAGHDAFLSNNRLRLSTRVDLSGADSEYMRTEFGITTEEANRTRFRRYQPDGGLKSVTLGVSAEYFFSDRLSLWSRVEAEHYLGDAAKSPLVTDVGRRTTIEASVLFRWRF